MLRINHAHFGDTPTRAASSSAEQHILCFCQRPWPLFTKHGICLAYGSSVGSSRQARRHPLPSATRTPSKHSVFLPHVPSFIIRFLLCFIFSSTQSALSVFLVGLSPLLCWNIIYFFSGNYASHLPSIIPPFPFCPPTPYLTSHLFAP